MYVGNSSLLRLAWGFVGDVSLEVQHTGSFPWAYFPMNGTRVCAFKHHLMGSNFGVQPRLI